jgi:hypothetical protein
MLLLTIIAHLLNILICIFSNSWIIVVWANDNTTIVRAVFRIRVGAAASKARPQMLSATITACTWKIGGQRAALR